MKFDSLPSNQLKYSRFYVTCICKDEYGATNQTTRSITVYTAVTDSNVNVGITAFSRFVTLMSRLLI